MNRNFYNDIDDYITGKLSQEERKSFERELLFDEGLRKELILSRKIMTVVLDEEDCVNLKSKLIEAKENTKKKSIRIRYRLLSASCIIILICTSFFFWQRIPERPDNLYTKYYQGFDVPSLNRGISGTREYDELLFNYKSKNFTKIINELEIRVESDHKNNILDLMLISAYLEINKPEKAETLIKTILGESDSGIFVDHYKWYLSLAFLNQFKINDAIRTCKEIENSNNKFAVFAQKLRKDLEKLPYNP
ncbi:MAG: hypothetical protein HXX16_05340 [Bacteroidales bacterium]|nr:hypothetical protein [Bacteroidales bacterium]